MSSTVDGSLAIAGIITAVMVSVLAIRGTVPGKVYFVRFLVKAPLQVKKAA